MARFWPALLFSLAGFSQVVPPGPLTALEWRGIGPAATGGRISDIAAARTAGQPAAIYIAVATGGIFKSVNEGVSFTSIFDRAGGMISVGAIAVAPSNPSIVWAGGGESDNRQSSSWGDGVYKSGDAGEHWQNMGLAETRHIGRVVIHPTDPDIVYVAAVGHLWGSNPERGVYKTTDGGQSWKKILYRNPDSGATDLAMDPGDPNTLFAAMYQRQRKGWGFNGSGPGSGLYRTTDGGATWTELTNGLPAGEKGRIGVAVAPGDGRVVYAIVEAGGEGGVYRSLDRGQSWERMNALNPRPMYFSRIYVDPGDVSRVYVMGSNRGFYVSQDGGRNFRDIFSGVHSEDHAMWIDPANTNHLVIGGDGGVSISFDRGLTWLFRMNLPLGQFYNISVNRADPFLVCGGLQDNGSWCTPSASRMGYGLSFKDAFNVGAGDGMHALFDGDDRTLLVSSQNGNTTRVDLANLEHQNIGPVALAERTRAGAPAYRWYWTAPLIVSAFDPQVIYSGANVLFRSADRGLSWKVVSPDLTASIDRESLEMMGGRVPLHALSRHDGQAEFSALTAIAESPVDRNLLYTGADDGTLQRTRDGGQHWSNLTANLRGLPPTLNISGIECSRFAPGRIYLAVDGHFNDDFHPYVFTSDDYGQTWRAISNGLPQTSVHRIREHPANPDVLVAALETGVFVSFDRGAHWNSLGAALPPVPVYDIVFQEPSHALVAGTHGRGIWVLDHTESLAGMTAQVMNGTGGLFPVPATCHQAIYSGQYWFGAGEFFAPNPPNAAVLSYYLPRAAGGAEITILDAAGQPVRRLLGSGEAGLNRACWDLRRTPATAENAAATAAALCAPASGSGFGRGGSLGPVAPPGTYTITVTPRGGAPLVSDFTLLADPLFPISDADRSARERALMSAYTLQRQLLPARDAARTLSDRLSALRESTPTEGRATLNRLAIEVLRCQGQVNSAMTAAGRVQAEIDGYDGIPTSAQLAELDRAWSVAEAAAVALNQTLAGMPAVYSAAGAAANLPEVAPVGVPTRP